MLTKNPGQVGVPIRIPEHRTQLVPPVPNKYHETPWRVEKKVKAKKKRQPLEMSLGQMNRFNKNLTTIELSASDYSASTAASDVLKSKSEKPEPAQPEPPVSKPAAEASFQVKVPESKVITEVNEEDYHLQSLVSSVGEAHQAGSPSPRQELLMDDLRGMGKALRHQLFEIFKRDEEINKIMKGLPARYLEEELTEDEQEEQEAEDEEDEGIAEAPENAEELEQVEEEKTGEQRQSNRTEGDKLLKNEVKVEVSMPQFSANQSAPQEAANMEMDFSHTESVLRQELTPTGSEKSQELEFERESEEAEGDQQIR